MFALATLLAGVGLFAAETGDLHVDAAYVRAVPPGQPNSAAFMTLTNTGKTERALVAATSPSSATVELHTHRHEDGMMNMRRIERIEIPAGGSVTLAPGGLHFMLIGLKQPVQPGDQVALTLTFDDGQRLDLDLPVRAIVPPGAMTP